MGKKKGSKKKGSKKKGSKKGTSSAITDAAPTELELALRLELQQLERDVQIAKQETEDARQQNSFLQDEIRRTTEENNEYEAYIAKKAAQEKSHITALMDKNQQDIDAVDIEMKQIEHEFKSIKRGLNDKILAREAEIEKTRRQIEALRSVEEVRSDQEKRIRDLETEIRNLQNDFHERLQARKAQFLEEKYKFESDGSKTVHNLEQRAPQEALDCLNKHSRGVKAGNRRLRNRLLDLMAANKSLREHEESLREQNADLRRQLELDAELVKIIDAREEDQANGEGRTSVS